MADLAIDQIFETELIVFAMEFKGVINRKEYNNCRFGWETGGCQKMIYQSPIFCWRPMIEA